MRCFALLLFSWKFNAFEYLKSKNKENKKQIFISFQLFFIYSSSQQWKLIFLLDFVKSKKILKVSHCLIRHNLASHSSQTTDTSWIYICLVTLEKQTIQHLSSYEFYFLIKFVPCKIAKETPNLNFLFRLFLFSLFLLF